MAHFGQNSARFPCENANLPHCAYFTHIPPPPPKKKLIFIHLQCWEVLRFLTLQRQRCMTFRVLRARDFYTPLATAKRCSTSQHWRCIKISLPNHRKIATFSNRRVQKIASFAADIAGSCQKNRSDFWTITTFLGHACPAQMPTYAALVRIRPLQLLACSHRFAFNLCKFGIFDLFCMESVKWARSKVPQRIPTLSFFLCFFSPSPPLVAFCALGSGRPFVSRLIFPTLFLWSTTDKWLKSFVQSFCLVIHCSHCSPQVPVRGRKRLTQSWQWICHEILTVLVKYAWSTNLLRKKFARNNSCNCNCNLAANNFLSKCLCNCNWCFAQWQTEAYAKLISQLQPDDK